MGSTTCCFKRADEYTPRPVTKGGPSSPSKNPPPAKAPPDDPCATASATLDLEAALLGTQSSSMVSALYRVSNRVGRMSVTGRYHHAPRTAEEDYDIAWDDVLGTGYSGAVVKGRDRGTGDEFAIKRFNLRGISDAQREQVESEAEIFLSLEHPHVVTLVDVYASEDDLVLVMEMMRGGEVFKRVREHAQFSELDTSETVWQMLLAVHYIHSNNVVHRDLKLENFLYDKEGSNQLKLIDFGFSHIWERDEKMESTCGTLAYAAPEVLNKSYTSQCDLWSLGVATFVILMGYMPFSGTHRAQVRNIRAGAWSMNQQRWRALSWTAQDFIKGLLVIDPDMRMTAEQALKHDFILGRSKRQDGPLLAQSIKDALVQYAASSKFRRACMSMMAFSLTNEERAKVRSAFLAMDKDNSGAITLGEFKQAFSQNAVNERAGTMDDYIREIFDKLDTEHDEVIHYHEFLAAMVSTRIKVHDHMLRHTFRQFDKDKSGYITVDNLRTVLGETFDGAELEELISEADANCDGQISYEEFAAFLERKVANETQDADTGAHEQR